MGRRWAGVGRAANKLAASCRGVAELCAWRRRLEEESAVWAGSDNIVVTSGASSNAVSWREGKIGGRRRR